MSILRPMATEISSPTAGPPDELTLPVVGMTCASCVNRIERFLSRAEGVTGANVNLATERATVRFDPGIIDRAGIIRYQSPSIERLLGYGQSDLIGRSCFDFVHPSDLSRVRQVLDTMLEPGSESSRVGFFFLHRDGTWRRLSRTTGDQTDWPFLAAPRCCNARSPGPSCHQPVSDSTYEPLSLG